MADVAVLIVQLSTPRAACGAPIRLPAGIRSDVASPEALVEGHVLDRLASFDAVVVDARSSSGEEAEDLLRDEIRRIRGGDACCPVIVALSEDDARLGPTAVDAGAWDVVYSHELDGSLATRLEAAARLRRLRRRLPPPPEPVVEGNGDGGAIAEEEPIHMVGSSDSIRRVFSLIRRVAPFDVPVLLTGESGTGKELAALAIHERSPRSAGPFVPINCGAIPETLLESELFGYEKGAFTGATQSRKGRFEAAEGGTIFLDEVGELAPPIQVKLLRFLQDHVVERVGGRTGVALDVRVIAATNRDINAMVKGGEFREDLYFRLAVLTIHLPPLRERGEDVALMARFFLQRYAAEAKQPVRGFSRDAIEALLQHEWPGNVRELINRVRRAVVIAEGSLITPGDLGLEAKRSAPLVLSLREARREAELRCLRAALQRANGNKVEAARMLGISRTQLYELMARHQIPHNDHAWT